ncbi:hypothetical protein GCM10011507_06020 [Edaphobacter acidisoli]|uniref:Uncharacterized protein n=1 Tax=Edaphobacter acidisoli TaxID=2040573 RepID=A0A916RIG6_9BACT|nr:hypothetical protein GCM10011507_06020 [Edaphobacter acidisoli]
MSKALINCNVITATARIQITNGGLRMICLNERRLASAERPKRELAKYANAKEAAAANTMPLLLTNPKGIGASSVAL